MLYEEWKSRYKNLKNFNTVLQRCPRFWPLAPPRGMNPGVYSLGISDDPPRYLSSKFDSSVRSDCWDISIWKTLTQCDGNGNGNANDRGDYNSSPCTSYRRAKKPKLSFLYVTCRLVLFFITYKYHQNIPENVRLTEWTLNQCIISVKYAKYHRNIPKGIPVTEQTRNLFQTKQRELTPKVRKAELSFLYPTRHLVLFYISTKYHKNIPKGLWLTERTKNQWIITLRHNKWR